MVAPDLSVPEWAAEHRMLVAPDPEPGPWRNDRTPYLTGIMEVCSPAHPARYISGMMGVQVGKTSFALNVAGWAEYTGGHSIVIGVPAESDAKEWSSRLMSMLSASSGSRGQVFETRGRQGAGQMTTRMLYRGNGTQIKFGWSGSPRTFAMTQASIVIGDEVDRWVTRAKEGSPEDLLANRATNSARAKIIFISSPVVESQSRIYPRYCAGDQRMFFVPCASCGRYQVLEWERMVWPRRPDYQETAGQQLARCSEIGMACVSCGSLIQERNKGKFLSDGLWVATQGREEFVASGFDSGDLRAMQPIFSEMGRAVYVSFHLSSLYAPWGWKGASWPDLAMAYEQARNDPEKHKAFVTTRLAKPWKDNAQRPEAESLHEQRLAYSAGVVPAGAAFVTVYSDIQHDRLEYEAVAHGPQGQMWSIEYRSIPGSPLSDAPWIELRQVLNRAWPTEGGMTLPTIALGIDTGYQPQRAYRFAQSEARPAVNSAGYRISQPRTVVLLKGATRGWNRAIEHYSPYEAAHKRGGLYVFHVGTSFLKVRLYEYLRGTQDGYGRCYFPQDYELQYFDGLTSEELVVERGRSVFRKIGSARNEPLDCRVGNMALGDMLGLHRVAEAEWARRLAATVRAAEPAATNQPAPAGRRVRFRFSG